MKHRNKLQVFFSTHFPFNTEGINELLDSFKVCAYDKGDCILHPGMIEKELKFVTSGFIREYYLTDSKEVNINFFGETEFSTDINSFYNSTPTKRWQECLTDVTAQTLSKEVLDHLLQKYHCGKEIVTLSIQNLIKHKDNLEYNRTTKDTEELYKELQQNKSEWLQNIPQYHIASYLNVTPETLSRIRKRIS